MESIANYSSNESSPIKSDSGSTLQNLFTLAKTRVATCWASLLQCLLWPKLQENPMLVKTRAANRQIEYLLLVTRAATRWKLPKNSPAMISAPSPPPPPPPPPYKLKYKLPHKFLNLRTRSLKYPTISRILH